MLRIKKVDLNLPLILDTLFRLARDFPRCIPHVAQFLINNRELCNNGQNRERIVRWIYATFAAYPSPGQDFEISWCLLVCAALKIEVRKTDISATDLPSATVLALIGLLSERNLLDVPLRAWKWRSEVKKLGVYSNYWLVYYEAVRRKWTKDKTMSAQVKANPVFARMLAKKVTFLEDRIFDVGRINVSSRRFTPTLLQKRDKDARTIKRADRQQVRIVKRKIRGFGDVVLPAAELDY
jgi:hypothetical protein